MKKLKWLFPVFCLWMAPGTAQTEAETIRALRQASNEALQAYDNAAVLSYLTEDALTTTGNGTLLSRREALKDYIAEAGPSKMYWVRTPDEIVVNETNGLAWENGTWKGYDPDKGSAPVVGGRYAAMWTRAGGSWKIKSQLFVSLE